MTTEPTTDVNPDLAFGDEEGPAPLNIPTKSGNQNIQKVPDAANPLICKLVPNPLRSKEIYYQVDFFKHMIGPDQQKDNRYHLSRKMLGERAPEAERYWEVKGLLSKLEETGKKDTEEYRKLDFERKQFNSTSRYWILVLPVGEVKPKALDLTYKPIVKLFGAPAKGQNPAIQGLVEAMRAKGRDPLSLKNDRGWLKIWRTGKGLETEWHIQEAVVEVTENGEDVTKPFRKAVDQGVFKLTKADIVDVTKLDQTPEKLWSEAECEAFVKSLGSEIPARCMKKSGGFGGGGQREQVENKVSSSSNEGSVLGNEKSDSDDYGLEDVL